MAKVRVRKGQMWDRGSKGFFTAGQELNIDDSLLEGGSGLNDIVEIIHLGHQAPVSAVEKETETEPTDSAEILDGEDAIKEEESSAEVPAAKDPPKNIKNKLLNLGKKKK